MCGRTLAHGGSYTVRRLPGTVMIYLKLFQRSGRGESVALEDHDRVRIVEIFGRHGSMPRCQLVIGFTTRSDTLSWQLPRSS
jgi:hypothetical protein